LSVVHVDNEDTKMAWLAAFLNRQKGNGLIYTGTRVNTDLFAAWLRYAGISAANYNAGLDAESRKEIEAGFLSNEWKCIVSTNALGMGIDKPDIRFIVHTQIPQSPIHYYQEIGRAGRDGKPTEIVLLFHPGDKELPEHFIRNSRPSIDKYKRVIDTLKQEPLGEHNLMRRTNLKQTQVRVIKADLIDQGIIREVMYGRSKKYEYQYNAPALDTIPFEELREFKSAELENMLKYISTTKNRMTFLCSYLGDVSVKNESQELGKTYRATLSEEWKNKIEEFRSQYFPELPVKSQNSNIVNGVAAAYYGFTSVGTVIHRCKYENGGNFPDHLLKQTLRAFRHRYGSESFDIVIYIPPTESGDLVKNFAQKIAKILGFPISHNLKKASRTKPQKVFQNSVLKRDNVKNAFIYEPEAEVFGKKILLIDDIFDSGATIKEIGRLLTKLGSEKIAPLVIAKTVGGDL